MLSSFHHFRLYPAAAAYSGKGPGDVKRNKCPSQTDDLHPLRLQAPGAQELDSVFFLSLCGWHVRDDSTGCEFPYSVISISGSCFP